MSFADSMDDLDAMNKAVTPNPATRQEPTTKMPSPNAGARLVAVIRRYSQRTPPTDLPKT